MSEVPIVPPMKASTIEKKAEEILRRYYPTVFTAPSSTPVDNFFEFIIPEFDCIKTSYTNLNMLGIAAECYTNATQKISIIDESLANDFTPWGRRRFRATVGHESGHCILHVPLCRWQASLQVIGKGMHRERSTMKVFEDPEWQAWRFAHAFCMPARTVIKAVNKWGTGPEGINALVETFDMNPAFVRTRLKMLKIIPADRAMISGKRNMPGIQMFRQTGRGLMDNLCAKG